MRSVLAAIPALLLVGCATVGSVPPQQFPERPETAKLAGSGVIEMCPGEKSLVYIQQYDVNPATQALYVTVNLARESGQEYLLAVVTVDDAGATTVYAGSGGEIRKFTMEEFEAKHPEPWCDFAGEHEKA